MAQWFECRCYGCIVVGGDANPLALVAELEGMAAFYPGRVVGEVVGVGVATLSAKGVDRVVHQSGRDDCGTEIIRRIERGGREVETAPEFVCEGS